MNSPVFQLVRVWAMLTGIFLAGWSFGDLSLGLVPAATLAMLVVAIGGFEICLFGQDIWMKRSAAGKGPGHG